MIIEVLINFEKIANPLEINENTFFVLYEKIQKVTIHFFNENELSKLFPLLLNLIFLMVL